MPKITRIHVFMKAVFLLIFVKTTRNLKADLIYKYFSDLTEQQKSQFEQLEELYSFWNSQINVISRKDIESLYERHVLHSLGIAKVVSFAPDAEILDVGTGGGFPGIPLAILFPETSFHLVDAVGKKIKVVQEVATGLGLKNVKAEQQRVEKINGSYDFVVSRAVTRMESFVMWVKNKISRNHFHAIDNGILYLKGGDLKEELAEAKRRYKIYNLSEVFEEKFFETKSVVHVPF